MDMCRFSSRDDIGYTRFMDALNSILDPLTKSRDLRSNGNDDNEEDEMIERQ